MSKYIFVWAVDGDYSPYHTCEEQYDTAPPKMYDSLEEIQEAILHVVDEHPYAVLKVYEVAREVEVSVELTKPKVKLS